MNTEREEKIEKLIGDLFFANKMVYRGEATKAELQPQVEEIKRELYRLKWGQKGTLTYLTDFGCPVVFPETIDWKSWDGWLFED